MNIKDILKKAKEQGLKQVVVEDGVYCLHWVDRLCKHAKWPEAMQMWVFVPN